MAPSAAPFGSHTGRPVQPIILECRDALSQTVTTALALTPGPPSSQTSHGGPASREAGRQPERNFLDRTALPRPPGITTRARGLSRPPQLLLSAGCWAAVPCVPLPRSPPAVLGLILILNSSPHTDLDPDLALNTALSEGAVQPLGDPTVGSHPCGRGDR